MKGFVASVCVLMSIGLGYCAYRQGVLDDVLPRQRVAPERVVYVEPHRESAAEWSERVYGDLYRDSGVPEIDEALRAHRALRALPDDAWPHEWLHRRGRARDILDGKREPEPREPERLVGASERARPRWAGERGWREWDEPQQRWESVPAGEAVKRFIWGVEDERL